MRVSSTPTGDWFSWIGGARCPQRPQCPQRQRRPRDVEGRSRRATASRRWRLYGGGSGEWHLHIPGASLRRSRDRAGSALKDLRHPRPRFGPLGTLSSERGTRRMRSKGARRRRVSACLTAGPRLTILKSMLKYPPVDRIFHALAEPNRRSIVEQLSGGPATVTELAAPRGITLAAVMQHVQVLERSGLVRTEKVGRVRTCRIEPRGLSAAERWIVERRSLWERRLDRLGDILAEPERPARQ